jgi:hypothetical protein
VAADTAKAGVVIGAGGESNAVQSFGRWPFKPAPLACRGVLPGLLVGVNLASTEGDLPQC